MGSRCQRGKRRKRGIFASKGIRTLDLTGADGGPSHWAVRLLVLDLGVLWFLEWTGAEFSETETTFSTEFGRGRKQPAASSTAVMHPRARRVLRCVRTEERRRGRRGSQQARGGRCSGGSDGGEDRKSTRLNSSHITRSRMPSSA